MLVEPLWLAAALICGRADILVALDDVLSGRARWAAICADNRHVLELLEPMAVDHVLQDPPYDDLTHAGARTLAGGDVGVHDIDFDSLRDFGFVADCVRASRRWCISFCSLLHFGEYRRAAPQAWVRTGYWRRIDGAPQMNGLCPAQPGEGIAILHQPDVGMRWNGGGKRGEWSCGVERKERHHDTPKPERLMVELVEDFTDADELVADFFAGSFTTGVAALRTGRRFIGVEIDPDRAAIGRARLEGEDQGLSMSAVKAGQKSLFGTMPEGRRPKRVANEPVTVPEPEENAESYEYDTLCQEECCVPK